MSSAHFLSFLQPQEHSRGDISRGPSALWERWEKDEKKGDKRHVPLRGTHQPTVSEGCKHKKYARALQARQGMLQSPRFLDLQLLTVYSTQTLCTDVTYLTWAIWTVVNLPCGHFARESFVRFSQEPIKRSLQQKNCRVIFVKSRSHIIQSKEKQHCILFFVCISDKKRRSW